MLLPAVFAVLTLIMQFLMCIFVSSPLVTHDRPLSYDEVLHIDILPTNGQIAFPLLDCFSFITVHVCIYWVCLRS